MPQERPVEERPVDAPPPAADPLDPTGALSELARIVQSSHTLEETLDQLVALARDRIPGADEVSMTLVEGDVGTTIASTGALALDLDERQYESGWGPCLDAAVSGELLIIDDSETETRWPTYIPKAREHGLGSSMSVALPTQPDIAGALNVYSRRPHSFDAVSQQVGLSFAAFAALALSQTRRYADARRQAETLQEAMRSRAVIEQAKGILMAARRSSASDAFDALVRLSQTRHVKLRDVAAQIVSEASDQPVTFEGP